MPEQDRPEIITGLKGVYFATSDASFIDGDIGKLLDASITGVDMPAKPAPLMDLSKIDFAALAAKFKESKHKNTDLEVLKATIRAQLEKLIRLNKTRADFAEKFEELIESYNTGSRNIEELFQELLKLSRSLTDEQQRHVRENISEEELVIFDILTRPAPELSADERAVESEGVTVPIDRSRYGQGIAAGRSLLLGVRPHDVTASAEGGIRASTDVVEAMGFEAYAHTRVGAGTFVARFDGSGALPRVGEVVAVTASGRKVSEVAANPRRATSVSC